MKYIVVFSLVLSLNTFAESEMIGPEFLKGEVKLSVAINPEKGALMHERETHIWISGEAAEKLYKDLQVKETPLPSLDGPNSDKQKSSADGNLHCGKTERGVTCSISINSLTGDGLRKSNQYITTPCNAVSDTDRDNVKDIKKVLKPGKESSSVSNQ